MRPCVLGVLTVVGLNDALRMRECSLKQQLYLEVISSPLSRTSAAAFLFESTRLWPLTLSPRGSPQLARGRGNRSVLLCRWAENMLVIQSTAAGVQLPNLSDRNQESAQTWTFLTNCWRGTPGRFVNNTFCNDFLKELHVLIVGVERVQKKSSLEIL